MICYECDMCGDLHYNIGEMNNVKISYAGRASCAYPNNGEFMVCDKCEGNLIEMLMFAKSKVTKEKKTGEIKEVEQNEEQGYWIKDGTIAECSICGHRFIGYEIRLKDDYCPFCNAKMKGE